MNMQWLARHTKQLNPNMEGQAQTNVEQRVKAEPNLLSKEKYLYKKINTKEREKETFEYHHNQEAYMDLPEQAKLKFPSY